MANASADRKQMLQKNLSSHDAQPACAAVPWENVEIVTFPRLRHQRLLRQCL